MTTGTTLPKGADFPRALPGRPKGGSGERRAATARVRPRGRARQRRMRPSYARRVKVEAMHARTQELIEGLEATRVVAAECELFGLLAQDVVDWSAAQRRAIDTQARAYLRERYAEVLAVVSPPKRGEAAAWRSNTAARYVDGLSSDELVDALRVLTRVRAAVHHISSLSKP